MRKYVSSQTVRKYASSQTVRTFVREYTCLCVDSCHLCFRLWNVNMFAYVSTAVISVSDFGTWICLPMCRQLSSLFQTLVPECVCLCVDSCHLCFRLWYLNMFAYVSTAVISVSDFGTWIIMFAYVSTAVISVTNFSTWIWLWWWLLSYNTILRSRADSLHLHVILHEWIAFRDWWGGGGGGRKGGSAKI